MRPKTSPVTACWRQRQGGRETIESQRWRQWDAEIQGAALSGAWNSRENKGEELCTRRPGGVVQHFRDPD